MSLNLPETAVWQAFQKAVQAAVSQPDNPTRQIQAAGLNIDLSLQHSSAQLDQCAQALLQACDFERMRARLFDGFPVNWTENRAALHTALRQSPAPQEITRLVEDALQKMEGFVEDCNRKNLYQNIVHLGIGGSDWGPRMIWEALRGRETRRTLRFAANIDAQAITAALDGLDPADTLLVVASKSFTTIESLTNAEHALQWMRDAGVSDPLAQTVALTANTQAARDFGVPETQIFEFWDWVGGRYSVWSSIGLSLALTLGWQTLRQLLEGAKDMDTHFLQAPVTRNAPVQMALSAVANTSVLGYTSQVACPYDARLAGFVMWLQQLEMESLGKSVNCHGQRVLMNISPAVWGMPGTDSQHTFFQWLHQDQQGAPVDFIIRKNCDGPGDAHHRMLLTNCLAQRAALWKGKSLNEAKQTLASSEPSQERIDKLAPHLVHPGRRPSTLIVLPSLSAHALGALLALYEHKVFVQSVLWEINPFDQWGVEFGKDLARRMLGDDASVLQDVDASTQYWLNELSLSQP